MYFNTNAADVYVVIVDQTPRYAVYSFCFLQIKRVCIIKQYLNNSSSYYFQRNVCKLNEIVSLIWFYYDLNLILRNPKSVHLTINHVTGKLQTLLKIPFLFITQALRRYSKVVPRQPVRPGSCQERQWGALTGWRPCSPRLSPVTTSCTRPFVSKWSWPTPSTSVRFKPTLVIVHTSEKTYIQPIFTQAELNVYFIGIIPLPFDALSVNFKYKYLLCIWISIISSALVCFVFKEELKSKAEVFNQISGPSRTISTEEYQQIFAETGLDLDDRLASFNEKGGQMEKYIAQYVNFVKIIPGFRELCSSDVAKLVKGAVYYKHLNDALFHTFVWQFLNSHMHFTSTEHRKT